MASKTADAHQFLVRLPKPLHKRLLAQAKRNNVSLNTEIVNQLEGVEMAATKQRDEAMKPFFEKTIENALTRVGRRLQIFLAIDGGFPRTEAEFEEQLRRMGEPPDRAARLLQMYRERRASRSRSGKPRKEPGADTGEPDEK
jgi:HicB family